tara:strand:+ start:1620 stop:2234 length:615 start_codon:yes stop_codon:yes gene_type:complete
MTKLERAIELAGQEHKGQFRKDGIVPFVCHPIEVMKTLRGWSVVDIDVLISAILHDTVEDATDDRREQLRSIIVEEFGLTVARVVEELTYIKGGNYADKKEYIASFDKKSLDAILVKLADRYCNVMDYLIADETRDYAPKYYEKGMPLYSALNYWRSEFIDKFGVETNDRLSNDYLWLAARCTEVKVLEPLTGVPRGGGPMRWS